MMGAGHYYSLNISSISSHSSLVPEMVRRKVLELFKEGCLPGISGVSRAAGGPKSGTVVDCLVGAEIAP